MVFTALFRYITGKFFDDLYLENKLTRIFKAVVNCEYNSYTLI